MYKTAKDYHYLYDKALWKRLRIQQLQREPLCKYCLEQGLITNATIADHIKPHEGSHELFFDADNLQSLCKTHHDSDKQMLERTGKRKPVIGVDGWIVE